MRYALRGAPLVVRARARLADAVDRNYSRFVYPARASATRRRVGRRYDVVGFRFVSFFFSIYDFHTVRFTAKTRPRTVALRRRRLCSPRGIIAFYGATIGGKRNRPAAGVRSAHTSAPRNHVYGKTARAAQRNWKLRSFHTRRSREAVVDVTKTRAFFFFLFICTETLSFYSTDFARQYVNSCV